MTTAEITDRATFLPDLCGVRALFGIVVIGELLAIVLTLVSDATGASALDRLSLISLFTQWVGLSAAAVLCIAGRWLRTLPEKFAASCSYFLILIVATVVSEFAWWVINPLTGIDPVIGVDHANFLVRSLGISAIVGALVLRYFYVQHHWKQQIVSEGRARLDALQARIRPHFFFNCMNTIASLTRTDPRAAEQAVEDLADLFRASMGEARNLVSFAEEFDLVRGYLNIETFRLGSRLRTDWDLETLPDAGLIPLLTLQPLVENAIYHGIEPLPEGGVIKISGTCDDDHVNISISNPLAGTGHSGHRGNQLAQENVKARLVAHFAGRGGLAIDTDGSTYRVTVKVPIELDDAHSNR